MRILILSLLLAIVASSCGTSKLKQQVKAHNYFNKYPNELAELCGTKFPPETKYLPGAPITIPGKPIIIPGDTVKITVDCPDGSKVSADCPPVDTVQVTDTLKITDTIQVQNTALITSLNYTIARQEGRLASLEQDVKDRDTTIKKRDRQLAILCAIAMGVTIFLLILYFKKK